MGSMIEGSEIYLRLLKDSLALVLAKILWHWPGLAMTHGSMWKTRSLRETTRKCTKVRAWMKDKVVYAGKSGLRTLARALNCLHFQ